MDTNQTNQGVTPQTSVQQAKATDNAGADRTVSTLTLQCSIRRKTGLVGLPGTDPNERVYKIGSSLDARTMKNLKGIDGEVERLYMPNVMGVASTDNNFQTLVNEYWGNISAFIPADDPTKKAEDQGKVIKISLSITGSKLRDAIEQEVDIVRKLEIINEYIGKNRITMDNAQIADYILLCYAAKYNRVARDITFIHMSPKIHFYIYNKSTAIKVQMSSIEARTKAINFFNELTNDEKKLDQMLVMFNLLPTSFETKEDKLIALDFEYNKNTDTLKRFVDYMSDKNLELKYLILYATRKGKLTNHANTEAYYYNQVPIGKTLTEAILFLGDETNSEAVAIKNALEKEITY